RARASPRPMAAAEAFPPGPLPRPRSRWSRARHDLAGRAVAALEGVVVDEGLLHRVQRPVGRGESLDGGHGGALRRHRQGEAGQYPAAVHQHRAGPALPVIAALLGPGEAEMLAQGIEQGGARIERQPVLAAVDVERERGGIARGSRWRLARLGGFGAERRYVNDNLADYLVPVNADVDQM